MIEAGICIVMGISILLIFHSNYFLFRVSKGLTLGMLWSLVFKDPIDDDLLHYTFFNLLIARILLFCTLISVGALTGGILYWIK